MGFNSAFKGLIKTFFLGIFKNLPSPKLNPIGPTNAGIYTFVLIYFIIRQVKITVSTLLVGMNVLV